MKTIEQFLSEVKADKELEQKLIAVKDEGELAEFLKANDVEGTIEEFRDLVEKERAIGELPDEELDEVAGGRTISFGGGGAKVIREDSSGRAIQWELKGKKYHYECPNCGSWMFNGGWGKKCESCDESWLLIKSYKKYDKE